MNAGSLFSGAGLLDYGLTLAGIEHSWLCEADEWRRGILAQRWPGVPIFDDVRAVDGSAPGVDLLVGGFPCRGASSAGDRAGMGNPETALWREMARIARELRPRYLLLENVANLLAVQRGAAWGEVLGDLAALGYVVAWDCLPAAAFGAPHLRDRVFAIACHADSMARAEGEPRGVQRPGALVQPGTLERAQRSDRDPAPDAAEPSGPQLAAADPCAPPDPECQPPELRGGHGSVPGEAGEAEGAPRQRERDRPAAGSGDADAADADDGRLEAGPQQDIGAQGGQPAPRQDDTDGLRLRDQWGEYAGAIARWEQVAGPAPEPLLRGVDARSTRRVVRSRLSALGDGVLVQAGEFLGRRILDYEQGRMSTVEAPTRKAA